ncbi:MAG: ferrochelatase [Rhodospirillaceae bacterium]|jgi:protoporphyrin/coproporphyrin ferrochelatase|nr:ferrochelatase [Rhodospirillaceae bacterium]
MTRIAVVLFNLGGPDSPEAVQPFLKNMFGDKAILSIPQPMRFLLARLIASRRAPVAREIYAELGGGSPLLPNTEAQARALESALADLGEVRAFVCMRYWHPRSDAVAAAVKAFDPDRIVLLPLYPQYSTTTSASSLADWTRAAKSAGLVVPSRAICCYPRVEGWIEALAALVRDGHGEASKAGSPRVLFSAHGLPERVVAGGDPYQWQIERTAEAVAAKTALAGLDWVVCYQSRVGPLEWIGPSTEEELARAGRDRVPVVVVPIAFVSEHSETLVELDIEYRAEADRLGIPAYVRVPAVAKHPAFIAALDSLVRSNLVDGPALDSGAGGRICPAECGRCALAGRSATP